jgi:hypothetical protein
VAGVYSTRFFAVSVGAAAVSYQIPAGKRAVIKCATAVNSGAASAVAYLYITGANLWIATVPGKGSSLATGLMIVVNAPELIYVATDGATLSLHASGYLLDL